MEVLIKGLTGGTWHTNKNYELSMEGEWLVIWMCDTSKRFNNLAITWMI